MPHDSKPQPEAPSPYKTHVQFVDKQNGPERLACEAELVFGQEYEALNGMKLVGFSLWNSAEGELYVTFPSRAFGVGGERRYFDYLRSIDASPENVKRVKSWMLSEYNAQRKG